MRNKVTSVLAFVAVTASASNSIAMPSHLAVPVAYDNVGVGLPTGQTFLAEATNFLGISFYIGDPTRPGLASVNELTGLAELVLYDVTNPTSPTEVARQQVQNAADSSFGLTTFSFLTSVPTTIGTKYLAAIDASDAFGIGLRSLNSSTYSGGAEAFLTVGGLQEHLADRDTAFQVNSASVPEPSTYALGLLALLLATKARIARNSKAERPK